MEYGRKIGLNGVMVPMASCTVCYGSCYKGCYGGCEKSCRGDCAGSCKHSSSGK
mgnify:CR=1 FL=1|jgi:hypothetical protein